MRYNDFERKKAFLSPRLLLTILQLAQDLAGGFRTFSFFHGFGHGDLSLVFKEWIWIPALLWIGSNNFRKDLGLFWFSFGSGFGLFLEDVGFFIRLFQLSKKEEVD